MSEKRTDEDPFISSGCLRDKVNTPILVGFEWRICAAQLSTLHGHLGHLYTSELIHSRERHIQIILPPCSEQECKETTFLFSDLNCR